MTAKQNIILVRIFFPVLYFLIIKPFNKKKKKTAGDNSGRHATFVAWSYCFKLSASTFLLHKDWNFNSSGFVLEIQIQQRILKKEPNLLQKVNCGLEVKAKVNKLPFNALSLIFLLLQNEHGVVEELLELLICIVNAQLLKGVHLQKEWFQSTQCSCINTLNFYPRSLCLKKKK